MVTRDAAKKGPVQTFTVWRPRSPAFEHKVSDTGVFQSKSLSSLFLRCRSSLYKINECSLQIVLLSNYSLSFFFLILSAMPICFFYPGLWSHIICSEIRNIWYAWLCCWGWIKKMYKKKGKDGKTMFRILLCASSVINPDSQAVLCLLAP